MTPPTPESPSPRRRRSIRLTTWHNEVRLLYWPPPHPTGYRTLRIFDRDGHVVGRLVWVVCDECHVGSIHKISNDPGCHRQGLGRRLIRRALADCPGYRWQTTHQSPRPTRLPRPANGVGRGSARVRRVCSHPASPPGYQPRL